MLLTYLIFTSFPFTIHLVESIALIFIIRRLDLLRPIYIYIHVCVCVCVFVYTEQCVYVCTALLVQIRKYIGEDPIYGGKRASGKLLSYNFRCLLTSSTARHRQSLSGDNSSLHLRSWAEKHSPAKNKRGWESAALEALHHVPPVVQRVTGKAHVNPFHPTGPFLAPKLNILIN